MNRRVFASFEKQDRGSVLVVGNPIALFDFIRHLTPKAQMTNRGVWLTRADSCLTRSIPLSVEPLMSGALIEWYTHGVGIRISINGTLVPGAVKVWPSLIDLKQDFSRRYGSGFFYHTFAHLPEDLTSNIYPHSYADDQDSGPTEQGSLHGQLKCTGTRARRRSLAERIFRINAP